MSTAAGFDYASNQRYEYITMSNESLTKAAELIDKSEHLALLFPAKSDLDVLVASEVLLQVLDEQGKRVGILNRPQGIYLDQKSFPKLAAAPALPKEFIVSIDVSQNPVSQLRYEKTEEKVDIILSPKSNSLKPELVSFKDGKLLCECLISLGIEDLESWNEKLGTSPEFFTETPIINLDYSPRNKSYGEVNLINDSQNSLTEIIYRLISALREQPVNPIQATLLLTGVLNQTRGLNSWRAGAETLLIASELLRLGANHKNALEFIKTSQPFGMIQLCSRAVVRSKTDSENQAVWSFLTEEDFEKTGQGTQGLQQVVDHLEASLPSQNSVLTLLWQDPEEKTVQAIVAGRAETVSALAEKETGNWENARFRPAAVFPNFLEAEQRLSALLKEINSSKL